MLPKGPAFWACAAALRAVWEAAGYPWSLRLKAPQIGADGKLVGWDRLVADYRLLEKGTDRMQVVELGPSTEGKPFLALFISSPANLSRLESLRQTNARLADPRGLSEPDVRKLVADGRAVVVQSFAPEEAGKTGVIGAAIYSGWGHMGFHWITPFHNIAGMLTESASARLAMPVFMHRDQIRGGAPTACRPTTPRRRCQASGRAGGGASATSSSTRRLPRGRSSIRRAATARRCSGTPI